MSFKEFLFLILILFFIYFALGFIFPNLKIFGFSLFPYSFLKKEFRFGLDLTGGVRLEYEADLSQITAEQRKEAMEQLKDIIERRVNFFGVTEPQIFIRGENKLVIELPGVESIEKAIEWIGQTPWLEFWEEKDSGFEKTQLTGRYLKRADVSLNQTTGEIVIELEFNDEGTKLFQEITKRNVGKRLAIFLDGKSIIDTDFDGKITENDLYAPLVREEIAQGKAIITGEKNLERARLIAKRLNQGALNVPIGEPISQQLIGPTLGKISFERVVRAGIFGFFLIILFLILFYRLPGILSSISLIVYGLIMLILIKAIPVTLTLAGLAGFFLSLGMAVDANILIFSRMKEERKIGKELIFAIEEGIKRSWPAIRDGNFTTILVGLILLYFGTSFVKGFALTLVLGNFISLFSAMVLTRYFLEIFARTKLGKFLFLW